MSDPSPALAPTDHAGVKVPPPLLYAVGLGAGLLLQPRLPLLSWPQSVGIALALPCLIFGVALCSWAIALFRRFRTSLIPIVPSAALVTTGLYRLTRNPMYVGLGFIYAGISLWLQLSWGLLLLPAVLVSVYYLVIVREERYLERRFGEAYARYKAEVRRWL
jgi:protein-S-isoprenylcysteine O-methyltransferase Ste14